VVAQSPTLRRANTRTPEQFLLAAGSAGIEAATNIVVRKANRTMLLWCTRGDRAVLHHLPQLARGAGGGAAAGADLDPVRGADGGLGIGVKVATCR
jgi:hypothetical protein